MNNNKFRPARWAASLGLAVCLPLNAHAIALLDGYDGPAGYGEYAMQNFDGSFRRNDDGSSNALNLPFEINFFGNTYNNFFTNTNGNITFGSSLSTYTPDAFTGDVTGLPPIIAPYWGDVDTRCTTCGEIYVAAPNPETLVVTWNDVGYYSSSSDKTNDFQLVLRDRSADTGTTGDFDIEFRYNRLEWTTGSASGGSGGLGGTEAVAGYDSSTGQFNTLPGSLTADVLNLQNSSNVSSTTPGLWSMAIRNGQESDGSTPATPLLPVIVEQGFEFEFDIEPERTIWIDPLIAVGYDYEVNSGPNMATVTLPTGIGDDVYDLFLWDASLMAYLDSGIDLTGGVEFDLTSIDTNGLARFGIRGIEVEAGLDPDDPTAFVTGLSFMEAGSVSMSQIPVSVEVEGQVPEPQSLALFGLGLTGLCLARRRKKAA